MSKKYDEARLQQILADSYGGKAEDWQCTGERTISDAETEYKYHNPTLLNGHGMTMMTLIGADGSILWPEDPVKVAQARKLQEDAYKAFHKKLTDAAKQPGDAVAAARLASLLSYEDEKFTFETDPEEKDHIIADLTEKAGRALAQHFVFALSQDEEHSEPQVIITSAIYWKNNGCCDDQTAPVDHLLPQGFSNDMESTWGWYGKETTIAALGKDLQKAGFVWNRDFQDFIDKKLTQELSDALRTPFSTLLDGLEPVAGPDAPLRLDTDHEHHQLSPVNPSTADDKPASPPKKKLQKRMPKP